MRTPFPSTVTAQDARQWWILDANAVPMGRLATVAARLLMGKDKTTWTPFIDTGDFVVIVNGDKALLTGRKEDDKTYRWHTLYPGGFREVAASKMRARRPVRMVELAIQGMLPKTRLGRAMARKLKVHAGPEHPHGAQAPKAVDLSANKRETA